MNVMLSYNNVIKMYHKTYVVYGFRITTVNCMHDIEH